MTEQLNYAATCLFGLEGLVGEEVDALGYTRRETIDGRVYFSGDISAIARCNMWFRYAERLYIDVGSFTATTFTELFDGTKALPWEDFIGKEDAFPVSGHSVRSKLFSIPDCQSIVKKAIVERLKTKYGLSLFPESKTKIRIEFFILNDRACLMIDTSGNPLFKRGYRTETNEAPIRETLAAAMVKLSRPRENVLFWDPLCGSGTLPIEATLMMKNIAPGINRRFASEHFEFVPRQVWRDTRDEARSAIVGNDFHAFASDIDENCVALTKENAKRAGISSHIDVFRKDALKIEKHDLRTTLVFNPPYGERMFTVEQARDLYRKLGNTFGKLVPPWQMYVITSEEDFEKLYGKKADKVRKLYNGMIKCNLYQYFKK